MLKYVSGGDISRLYKDSEVSFFGVGNSSKRVKRGQGPGTFGGKHTGDILKKVGDYL